MEQTDRSQRGGRWRDWNRLAKEHVYTHGPWTDNNVVKAGRDARWRGAK